MGEYGRFDCDSSGPAPVPKTGQTTCYDESGTPRGCTGTGEDGEYQKGVAWPDPRFTVPGGNQDVVVDNLTGLMWTKDANMCGLSTWQLALDSMWWINGFNTYGYDDWRVPNIKELQSLIDFSQYGPALPSGHPFINVQFDAYWSSTTYVDNTGRAWSVTMSNGSVYHSDKSNSFYVWPVRGGQ